MNVHRTAWRQSCIVLILLTLPLSIGCGNLGAKRDPNSSFSFIKPLGGTASGDATGKPQPNRSERSLCIETAQTVAQQGHAVEAIKLFEHAEALEPTAPPLDAELAPLYADVGNHDAAIERYQRCLQSSPDDAAMSNNYAWTLMEARRFEQAIAEATRGLQHDADNVRLRSTLAMIYYRQGDHGAALQHFAQAQGTPAAHHNLAILEIDAGKLDSARDHLQIAMQSSPPNSPSEALLSALQTQTENF